MMVKSPRLVLKGVTVTKGMWGKITDAMQEVGMIVKRKGKPAQVNFVPEKRYKYIEVAGATKDAEFMIARINLGRCHLPCVD